MKNLLVFAIGVFLLLGTFAIQGGGGTAFAAGDPKPFCPSTGCPPLSMPGH